MWTACGSWKMGGWVKAFYTTAGLPHAVVDIAPSARRAPDCGVHQVRAETRGADPGDEIARRSYVEPCPARIAVYDALGAPPRVEEIAPVPVGDYISQLASRTYEIARAMGGSIPFSVVSEVVENYIHADFREPVVTILDSGDTIRFADQGPGIADKRRAVEPGYTTATREMKRYVRGVGSGLPLARECLSFSGGSLQIEDNLGCGAVVTVSNKTGEPVMREAQQPSSKRPQPDQHPPARAGSSVLEPSALPTGTSLPDSVVRLTNRQKRVLALVMDAGSAGPSLVARELAIGLSTAYRDLARLEELNLISADDSGKRVITEGGARFLQTLLHAE